MTIATDALKKAYELVGGDRANTHGDKLRNHENIARLQNAFRYNRPNPAAPLTASETALMMCLLKIARTQLGKHNPDDFIDLMGYGAVALECRELEMTGPCEDRR